MEQNEKWLQWAVELQALAQAGLTYGKDVYDRERYQRIREIAAELLAAKTGLSMEQVTGLFCEEAGYQTPKLDTRAAIFQDDQILLVHENDGTWCLPGGWCDVNISAAERGSRAGRAGRSGDRRSGPGETQPARLCQQDLQDFLSVYLSRR